MLFGAHVSIAGGIFNAPLRAAQIGCEVFQMFTRSPQGGQAPELTPASAEQFKKNCASSRQREWFVHCPYFINFASKNSRLARGSAAVVRGELERASLLGARFVMTHLGSYKDLGSGRGLGRVAEGLEAVLRGYRGSAEFLIEISAGAGDIIGDAFEEVADIIYHPKLKKFNIGVCFDTQHAFGGGYDLRTPEAVAATLKKFDGTIGLERLKLLHGNDSKVSLASHRDRHEHIGQGQIGRAGFAAIVGSRELQKINLVCETEPDEVKQDIALLKKIRARV